MAGLCPGSYKDKIKVTTGWGSHLEIRRWKPLGLCCLVLRAPSQLCGHREVILVGGRVPRLSPQHTHNKRAKHFSAGWPKSESKGGLGRPLSTHPAKHGRRTEAEGRVCGQVSQSRRGANAVTQGGRPPGEARAPARVCLSPEVPWAAWISFDTCPSVSGDRGHRCAAR